MGTGVLPHPPGRPTGNGGPAGVVTLDTLRIDVQQPAYRSLHHLLAGKRICKPSQPSSLDRMHDW